MMKMKIFIPHESQAAAAAAVAADHDVVARGGGGGSTKDARASERARRAERCKPGGTNVGGRRSGGRQGWVSTC
jgi:hypothetical protein